MNIAVLQITKDCNQDCFYCCRDRSFVNENIENIKKKIDSLEKPDEIIITGGEPSLLDNLDEIISYTKTKSPNVHLQTNGINFANINECKDIVNTGVTSVLVALPSFNKELCEQITQTKGEFDKKIQGLINLSQFKQIAVGVVFVITKLNYKEIPGYVQNVANISRDIYLQFSFMIRYDNLDNMKEKVVRYSELQSYLNNGIKKALEKNMQVRIDGVPLCFIKEYAQFASDLITKKVEFTDNFINMKQRKYNSDNYIGKEHIKPKNCNICFYNNICKGVYQYYYKLFGGDELIPITNDKKEKEE